ncbi:MAG: hypothetical protein A4E62_01772 [Syntrophorhabdus sp. PtaU1.Bin002]|nr:MAG: hypothetical protein A4E62_01772 [Syntrophorhabdus sp. PtaU1.Bin002]
MAKQQSRNNEVIIRWRNIMPPVEFFCKPLYAAKIKGTIKTAAWLKQAAGKEVCEYPS